MDPLTPPNFGDPSAMHELAGELGRAADKIATSARGFSERAESLDFEGPAATRFRASMITQRRVADHAANRALDLSELLRRAAERAHAEIREWERIQALLREEGR